MSWGFLQNATYAPARLPAQNVEPCLLLYFSGASTSVPSFCCCKRWWRSADPYLWRDRFLVISDRQGRGNRTSHQQQPSFLKKSIHGKIRPLSLSRGFWSFQHKSRQWTDVRNPIEIKTNIPYTIYMYRVCLLSSYFTVSRRRRDDRRLTKYFKLSTLRDFARYLSLRITTNKTWDSMIDFESHNASCIVSPALSITLQALEQDTWYRSILRSMQGGTTAMITRNKSTVRSALKRVVFTLIFNTHSDGSHFLTYGGSRMK